MTVLCLGSVPLKAGCITTAFTTSMTASLEMKTCSSYERKEYSTNAFLSVSPFLHAEIRTDHRFLIPYINAIRRAMKGLELPVASKNSTIKAFFHSLSDCLLFFYRKPPFYQLHLVHQLYLKKDWIAIYFVISQPSDLSQYFFNSDISLYEFKAAYFVCSASLWNGIPFCSCTLSKFKMLTAQICCGLHWKNKSPSTLQS